MAGCGGLHNPEGEAAWSSPTGLGDRASTKPAPARSPPSAVPAQAAEEPLCLGSSPTSGAVPSAVPGRAREVSLDGGARHGSVLNFVHFIEDGADEQKGLECH